MKKILLFLLLLPLAFAPLRAQDEEEDAERYRPVRVGMLLQANLAGEQMYIAESVLSAYPGIGVEAGGFADYQLARRLLVEVQCILALQSGTYVAAREDPGFLLWNREGSFSRVADMRLVGMDIPPYKRCAFARLYMLKLDNLPYTVVHLKGNAISKITGC